MRGFTQSKIRVTALVGGNLAGEKLKPFIIGASQNPHALRGVNRDELPCYYKASKKSWMNSVLFWNWYMDCFISEMEERHGEDFSVLLLLDNCSAHPKEIADYDPRVIVCFLPANTTSLIQPMDQGIIRNFKLKIFDIIYRDLIHKIDETPLSQTGENLMVNFYKNLNIYDCLQYCGKGWEKVKKTTMVNCWHKLLDMEQLKDMPAFKDIVPHSMHQENVTEFTSDTIMEENTNLINELVETISQSSMGQTSVDELDELLTYDELDLFVD